ncbi:MAG: Nramp family divalent metal transporter [Planctomycetes bacterium]|nr:Nramp family divalent metal transporter [Planctomycetota bacterium]
MADLPKTCLPDWDVAELPEPKPLGLKNLAGFIGPGIVMCGFQLAGGEWLLGAEITARYGGSLMWIAAVAIIGQVFYNMECGRYALYTGEPVFTGFMRAKPGPQFWIGIFVLLSIGAFIPGLSTHGAAVLAALILNRVPGEEDRWLVTMLAFILLGAVSLPILVGGKVYNMMQAVMTTKVFVVLGFCLIMGVMFVKPQNWANVFSGFFKVGNMPVVLGEDLNGNGTLDPGEDFDRDERLDVIEPVTRDSGGKITDFEDIDGDGKWDGENVTNVFLTRMRDGEWPLLLMTQVALLGAFAGFAGGGGLSNSTYSNYCRDKGWGMGSEVGAIPSAVGGRNVTLSHLGTVFEMTDENLRRWKAWWKYIIMDQVFIWMPGCFMGMALPALISMQFSPYSQLFHDSAGLDWAQAIISADGIRNAPGFSPMMSQTLWIAMLIVGLLVLLPSQMSIVEDVCRRWTDIIWSGSRHVRETMKSHQVGRIYYTILAFYVVWTFVCAWYFTKFENPKVMVLVIANLNNIGLGFTAFFVLRNNLVYLPKELRPGWIHRIGILGCGVFYLGMAALVFYHKQLPILKDLLGME